MITPNVTGASLQPIPQLQGTSGPQNADIIEDPQFDSSKPTILIVTTDRDYIKAAQLKASRGAGYNIVGATTWKSGIDAIELFKPKGVFGSNSIGNGKVDAVNFGLYFVIGKNNMQYVLFTEVVPYAYTNGSEFCYAGLVKQPEKSGLQQIDFNALIDYFIKENGRKDALVDFLFRR